MMLNPQDGGANLQNGKEMKAKILLPKVLTQDVPQGKKITSKSGIQMFRAIRNVKTVSLKSQK